MEELRVLSKIEVRTGRLDWSFKTHAYLISDWKFWLFWSKVDGNSLAGSDKWKAIYATLLISAVVFLFTGAKKEAQIAKVAAGYDLLREKINGKQNCLYT